MMVSRKSQLFPRNLFFESLEPNRWSLLVDLAPKNPLFVFVEVVATDGPVTERRKEALYHITDEGNHDRTQVTFVTAYLDKDSSGFKKTFRNLAWNSVAWFVSEPDKLIIFKNGAAHLAKLNILN